MGPAGDAPSGAPPPLDQPFEGVVADSAHGRAGAAGAAMSGRRGGGRKRRVVVAVLAEGAAAAAGGTEACRRPQRA